MRTKVAYATDPSRTDKTWVDGKHRERPLTRCTDGVSCGLVLVGIATGVYLYAIAGGPIALSGYMRGRFAVVCGDMAFLIRIVMILCRGFSCHILVGGHIFVRGCLLRIGRRFRIIDHMVYKAVLHDYNFSFTGTPTSHMLRKRDLGLYGYCRQEKKQQKKRKVSSHWIRNY